MANLNVEVAVPFATRTTATITPEDFGKTLKTVSVKTFAALIAGGALALNVWIAGIFNSGHPVKDFSLPFFLLIFAQAIIVTYVIAFSGVVAVDVAGGILGGTLIIIIVEVAGAFRGAFDLAQFIGQLLIAYFAVAATIFAPAIYRAILSSEAEPQSDSSSQG